MGGLILGLFSLGNLLQPYGNPLRIGLGFAAALMLLLYFSKLLLFFPGVREELNNIVIASVFPTLPMAMMVFATYLRDFHFAMSLGLWGLGLTFHLLLILWFSLKFLGDFNIKKLLPSWFVVYIGIGVGAVTAKPFGMEGMGQLTFWLALIMYGILLLPTLYRVIKVRQMPEPTLPTLTILAAPAGLCLTGYINSFGEQSFAMIYLLLLLSIISYLAILPVLPRLLRLNFYPSFSAFTFPLIINCTGIKQGGNFLAAAGIQIFWLDYLVSFQIIVATGITLYVLGRYASFLLPALVPAKEDQVVETR